MATTVDRPETAGASRTAPATDGLDGSNVVLATTHYNVVGTRPVRHDGVDKVTGRALYGADVKLPGLLYGRVLRSPHAHARIRSIDTSRALAFPGVRAVATSADLPEPPNRVEDLGEGDVNLRYLSSNVLARDKALYKGHAIAAVAAIDQHVAEEALRLIDVDYEVLPPLIDVREAMRAGAPILDDDLRTESLAPVEDRPTNIAEHEQFVLGDPDAGFREADVIVEREITTATVHQGYIEPQNGTAMWNADGNLTIWCSTQGSFTVRTQCAQVLQHPVAKIKVVPQEIGGGFGGKIPIYLEPLAAILSRKTGRPVKLVMTRAEVFQGTGPTPGSYVRVKMGAKRDGTLCAGEAEIAFEAGAFPGAAIGAAAECVFACYDVPNGRIDAYDVVVNKPKSAPYRAPGAPQAAFAAEQVIDELAEKLGIDPLEFRLRNCPEEGTRKVDGIVYQRIGCREVLEAAKAHPHYAAALEPDGPNGTRRAGVANGYWFNIGLQSSVTISVNVDGSVNLVEGSTDIGGTRTSVAMQAAEVLGLDVYDVKPVVADTDSIGYTGVTGGSRVTYATGWAAIEAARDLLNQMKERAAEIWEAPAEAVDFLDGAFVTVAGGSKRMTFKELASQLKDTGGTLVGRATIDPPEKGGAFATNIVDVEVDPETGKVQVLRFTVVQDAGKAIHPSYVEGQMQGGSVQGIGWALNEEYFMNDRGEMVNATLLDYRMPTALDLPMIDTVIIEVPNPDHPFGVRGVGEVPIIAPPAAIANAIYHAIGVRLDHTPMSPRAILEATGKIEKT